MKFLEITKFGKKIVMSLNHMIIITKGFLARDQKSLVNQMIQVMLVDFYFTCSPIIK